MFNSARAIHRFLPLVLAFVAVATPAQAASGPDAREAAFRALHWKHEDAVFGARQQSAPVRSVPLLWDAHWKHEDALYQPRDLSSGTQRPDAIAVPSGGGGNWSSVLTALAGAVALVVLGSAAAIGFRRNHRRVAPS